MDNNHQTFRRFRLTNSLGIKVELCSLGASVTSFRLPDKFGHFADVILGFDNAQDYLSDNIAIQTMAGRQAIYSGSTRRIFLYGPKCAVTS